jgi:hypothetical protein
MMSAIHRRCSGSAEERGINRMVFAFRGSLRAAENRRF